MGPATTIISELHYVTLSTLGVVRPACETRAKDYVGEAST